MKRYIDEVVNLTGDAYLNPAWPAHNRGEGIITSIAVHHDAAHRPHDYDSVARYRQEAAEHYNRLGPGLQYHYKIDNTGVIFKIRPHTVWLHALGSQANVTSINICLDGYFHPDQNQVPTKEQYEALYQLLDWLCEQNPQFPADYDDVYGHRAFSATACPGNNLIGFVDTYRNNAGHVQIPDVPYDWPEFQPQVTPPPTPPVVVPEPTHEPEPTTPLPEEAPEPAPEPELPEIPEIPPVDVPLPPGPSIFETLVQRLIDFIKRLFGKRNPY